MSKVTRVRTGCWTCKKRHRKCDEARPSCNNCISTNRKCEGYQMRLSFESSGWSADNGSVQKKGRRSRSKKEPLLESPEIQPLPVSASASLNTFISENPSLPSPKLEPDAQGKFSFGQLFGDVISSSNDTENSTHKLSDSALEEIFSDRAFSFPMHETQPQTHAKLDVELLQMIDHSDDVFDGAVVPHESDSSLVMSYQEENQMLKHFFQNLLPLLDAHPQSPWPALALRYCDFEVARSCFISLACIHIYESRKGGSEYYRKGMAHINRTMNHLIESISRAKPDGKATADAENTERIQLQSFVILVLVNVHILFAVLEQGKSSLSRYLFKVFGSVCQDHDFYKSLMRNESKGSLVVVLSWYDTVSAMVSPDCRLPFCSPDWYGSYSDAISTSQMMGCPGQIFRAMSGVCFLRHELHKNSSMDDETFHEEFERIKAQLFAYRDYVDFRDGTDYELRLKGAQCWSLAVYIALLRLSPTRESKIAIRAAVHEFIHVYGTMPSSAPIVTQMVWPVYAVGCECKTEDERKALLKFMNTLYETAQMGTLASLRWIVQQVWKRGISQEEVLEKMLEKGVDYLPL